MIVQHRLRADLFAISLFGAMLWVISAAAGGAIAQDGNIQSDLPAVVEDFYDRIAKKNLEDVTAFYAHDAALFPPGQDRVDGKESIAIFWSHNIAPSSSVFKAINEECKDGGELSACAASYSLVINIADDEQLQITGTSILVLELNEGAWFIRWHLLSAEGSRSEVEEPLRTPDESNMR